MLLPLSYCVQNTNVTLFLSQKSALLSPTLIGFLQGTFNPLWVLMKGLEGFCQGLQGESSEIKLSARWEGGCDMGAD